MTRIFQAPLPRLALFLLLAVTAAACEQLLVEPASPPTTSIALALAPSAPTFAVAPETANKVRVQVLSHGAILLDTILPFNPEQEELLVPVRLSASARGAALWVEISEDVLPLLRGSAEINLEPRRITEAVVSLEPANVFPMTAVFELTTGIYHSCAAVGEQGAVYCWGTNEEGQLGTGKFSPSSQPGEPIALGFGFYDLSAGLVSSCGLANEGQAYCWGNNEFGSLGVGNAPARSAVPLPVNTETGFSSISLSGLHACGLTFSGEALCWGFNGFGQLGDGSTTDRFTPVSASASAELSFESISAGYLHTCGISTRGLTYCWGLNEFGQLGDGTLTDSSTPVLVSGEHRFVEVSAGGLHSCGLTEAGEAFCWGFNGYGQLGNGSTEDQSVPQSVGDIEFATLSAGGLHSCGVAIDGDALCWGYNRSGALGDDTFEDSATPVVVTGGHAFTLVQAGLHHSCGTVEQNGVVCWGYNRFGQLGDGSRVNRDQPRDVLVGEPFFSNVPDNSGERDETLSALLRGSLTAGF